MTALCFAAVGGHAQIATELLTFGANPNVKALDGSTALLIASAHVCFLLLAFIFYDKNISM
jgi:ankyrin repeat protein